DRPLPQRNANAPTTTERVKTDSLTGITVAEFDWTARLKGKTPALDALAASIPADQHAVFFPSVAAAADLLAELNGDAIPLLGLALPHSEDGGVQRRYERQPGASLADVARVPAAATIRSLAATGSDPYLPSGTDLAILVETSEPDAFAT